MLHGLLDAAVRDEILIKNISNHCTLPRIIQKQIKPIITSELSTFLKAIEKEPFRNIFFVDIFSGLHQAEILWLRWEDIDWKNDCIHICEQYTVGENGNEYRNALKTSSSYRKLYLQPYVKEELYKAYTALNKTGRIKEYICELEGLPSPNAMTKRWRKFADNNGFKGVRLHDLRHSSAMIIVESGVDINTIKKQLGHSKISTTAIYLHNNFTASQKAAESVILSLFEPSKKLEKFSEKNSDQFKTNLG